MRIHFERTGGFAGMRLSTTVDSDELPEPQAEKLKDAVQNTSFFELPDHLEQGGSGASRGASSGADRFSYHITVEQEGRSHSVVAPESALDDALRDLVQFLESLARSARG